MAALSYGLGLLGFFFQLCRQQTAAQESPLAGTTKHGAGSSSMRVMHRLAHRMCVQGRTDRSLFYRRLPFTGQLVRYASLPVTGVENSRTGRLLAAAQPQPWRDATRVMSTLVIALGGLLAFARRESHVRSAKNGAWRMAGSQASRKGWEAQVRAATSHRPRRKPARATAAIPVGTRAAHTAIKPTREGGHLPPAWKGRMLGPQSAGTWPTPEALGGNAPTLALSDSYQPTRAEPQPARRVASGTPAPRAPGTRRRAGRAPPDPRARPRT
jgi:hypothetical protein